VSSSLPVGTPVNIASSAVLNGSATHSCYGSCVNPVYISGFGNFWMSDTAGSQQLSAFVSSVIQVPVGGEFSFGEGLSIRSQGIEVCHIYEDCFYASGTISFGAGSFNPEATVIDPSTGQPAPAPYVVPEPSSWLLMLIGVSLVLLFWGRFSGAGQLIT
jgi:hypothetical protein